ncbi:hypothetical protein RRG08_022365 [Elysia crispata]|uniref:Uncharacterized protein n=1 Tax=Elysia crispata TaxID=231223 RepID=A0AAE0Z1D0_9GAST|nr:hypothetical protein RRG08_022365 [Elysia crispata]
MLKLIRTAFNIKQKFARHQLNHRGAPVVLINQRNQDPRHTARLSLAISRAAMVSVAGHFSLAPSPNGPQQRKHIKDIYSIGKFYTSSYIFLIFVGRMSENIRSPNHSIEHDVLEPSWKYRSKQPRSFQARSHQRAPPGSPEQNESNDCFHTWSRTSSSTI